MQALYLFPSHTINDGLVDIEKDRPVFLRVFNPALHLVGLGVGFEVDHIAAVFLQGEDFFDGGVVPLGRGYLYRAGAGTSYVPFYPLAGKTFRFALFGSGKGDHGLFAEYSPGPVFVLYGIYTLQRPDYYYT